MVNTATRSANGLAASASAAGISATAIHRRSWRTARFNSSDSSRRLRFTALVTAVSIAPSTAVETRDCTSASTCRSKVSTRCDKCCAPRVRHETAGAVEPMTILSLPRAGPGCGYYQGMNKFLSGKTAVVTGGTRGIGRAIVERLLAEGASVAFCGRSAEGVQKAAASLGGSQAYG